MKRLLRYLFNWLQEIRHLPATLRYLRSLHETDAALAGLRQGTELPAALRRMEEMLRVTRHFLFLQAIHPKLASIFTGKPELSEEVLFTLANGLYRTWGDNKLISEGFIDEVLDVVQSTAIMPHLEAERVFAELRRSFPDNFTLLVRAIDFHYYCAEDDLSAMLDLCGQFEAHHDAENKNYKLTWLQYINALLSSGKRDKATAVLQRYTGFMCQEGLELFCQVADLALEKGLVNDDIALSANIWRHIMQNHKASIIESLIKDKMLAVVGNGPQEVGLGKGREIDAHDIVIRFHQKPPHNRIVDYGSKANIIVATDFALTKIQLHSSPSSFVIIPHIALQRYNKIMFEALYKLILKGIKLAHIPENNIFETRKGCSYSTPSMGAIGLTYFKRLKPELCNNDVYGFSYKDMISPGAENYQNIIIEHDSLNIVHDMKRESAYLRELMDYKGKCEVNV